MKGNVPTLLRGVLAMAAILAVTAAAVLVDALRAGVPLPRLAAFVMRTPALRAVTSRFFGARVCKPVPSRPGRAGLRAVFPPAHV